MTGPDSDNDNKEIPGELDFDPFTWNCFTFLDPPTDTADYEASMWAMWDGDFERLAARLYAAALLHFLERAFLAGILSGSSSEFVLKRRDGRRGVRRHIDRRRLWAEHAQGLIAGGQSRADAFKTTDAIFRSDRESRIKSIRDAHREFFPEEYGEPEDVDD